MNPMDTKFATVEEAVEEFHQGRPIVLVDDEDRENEGDLALPAEKITPAAKKNRSILFLLHLGPIEHHGVSRLFRHRSPTVAAPPAVCARN